MIRMWMKHSALPVIAVIWPLFSTSVTITPDFVIPTVKQTVCTYDADPVRDASDNVLRGSASLYHAVPSLGSIARLVAAESTSKGVQLVEDIVGPNAKATLNEAGDLVIESQNGLTKVRFDINRTVPHKNPHAHVEVFEQVKNKKVPVQKSGPIYPKDVPHE